MRPSKSQTIAFLTGFLGVSAAVALFASFPACSGDECSIQGWLSALSGWFAVGAAVVTVLYLLKQIRQAEKHHRINLLAQLLPQLHDASHTAAFARTSHEGLIDDVAAIRAASVFDPEIIQSHRTQIEAAIKLLHRGEFERVIERYSVFFDRGEATDELQRALSTLDELDPLDEDVMAKWQQEVLPLYYSLAIEFTGEVADAAASRFDLLQSLVTPKR